MFRCRKAKVAGGLVTVASAGTLLFLAQAQEVGAPMTAEFEGTVLHNYIDVVGVETWCTGETQLGRLESGYTKEYCQELFNTRYNQYSTRMYGCYDENSAKWVTPKMHAGFTDVAYNVGRYCSTGMVRALKRGKPVEACDFMLKYKRAGGKDCSIRSNNCYGVWDRRLKFHELCISDAKLLEVQNDSPIN